MNIVGKLDDLAVDVALIVVALGFGLTKSVHDDGGGHQIAHQRVRFGQEPDDVGYLLGYVRREEYARPILLLRHGE